MMITSRFTSVPLILLCIAQQVYSQSRHAAIDKSGQVLPVRAVSATIETDRLQTLADGNQIEQKTTSQYFRDEKGRVRLETPTGITIVDPVERIAYTLVATSQMAYKSTLSTNSLAGSQGRQSSAPDSRDLGTRVIDGRQTTGERYITVTPANSPLGNKMALVKVTEIWSARGLDLPVLVSITDPITGQMTTHYTNIVESAKLPSSLFEPPPNYRIQDAQTGAPTLNNPVQPKPLSVDQLPR